MAIEMLQPREAVMWGKAERPGLGQPENEGLGYLVTVSQGLKGHTGRMETVQRVTGKRQRVMGTSHPWGDPKWTPGDNFSQWEQWAIGIISPGKWWNPQHGAQFSEKGLGPSCLDCAFAKEHWARQSFNSLPTWYSMIHWNWTAYKWN